MASVPVSFAPRLHAPAGPPRPRRRPAPDPRPAPAWSMWAIGRDTFEVLTLSAEQWDRLAPEERPADYQRASDGSMVALRYVSPSGRPISPI